MNSHTLSRGIPGKLDHLSVPVIAPTARRERAEMMTFGLPPSQYTELGAACRVSAATTMPALAGINTTRVEHTGDGTSARANARKWVTVSRILGGNEHERRIRRIISRIYETQHEETSC